MMRPHVRGGTEMPNCLRAAYILHSPSNGFSSCFLRMRLRVGKSTPGLLVFACDLSGSPCTPSSHEMRNELERADRIARLASEKRNGRWSVKNPACFLEERG